MTTGSAKGFPEALWRVASRNIGLRVISLIIAAGLWLFVNAGQRNAVETLDVPIDYSKLPAGLVVVNSPPSFVKIEVTGPRTLLSLLDPERLAVKLNLSGIGSGEASFKISPGMFPMPRQTTVTNVSPPEVVLDVDRIVQRDVPVHVDLQGPVGNGYEIVGSSTIPPMVMAIGPSRFVGPLRQINTLTLDVRGASADVDRRVNLESPGPAIALGTTTVDAKVAVKEKIADREFHGLPVGVRDSDYRFRVNPTRASVTVRGPVLKLAEAAPNVYVDAKELTPGSHDVPLQVSLPDGLQVVRQSPERVRLRLYREKLISSHNEHAS